MSEKTNVYRRYALAGATFSCAISIGFLMQSSEASYAGHLLPTPQANTLSEVTKASLPNATIVGASEDVHLEGLPELPMEASYDVVLRPEPIARRLSSDLPVLDLPEEIETPYLACDITLNAEPMPAAMVGLVLTAPCLTGERVTIHHGDLRFTEVVGPDGGLSLSVPALTEQAVFIFVAKNGEGSVVKTQVETLQFYDRVVVQWHGKSPLELHAREFGADYGSDGHVWRENTRNVSVVAEGNKGFLTRLGNSSAPEPLLAEVYTFPRGSARSEGTVLMTLEAEITNLNCGRSTDANTIEVISGQPPKTSEITLEMPECDAVGELLVLKNLLQDLTIAGK